MKRRHQVQQQTSVHQQAAVHQQPSGHQQAAVHAQAQQHNFSYAYPMEQYRERVQPQDRDRSMQERQVDRERQHHERLVDRDRLERDRDRNDRDRFVQNNQSAEEHAREERRVRDSARLMTNVGGSTSYMRGETQGIPVVHNLPDRDRERDRLERYANI